MFKVVIAGSRDYTDYDTVKKYADIVLKNVADEIEIVSGRCRGVDMLGEKYAKERGYSIKYFPADWNRYKRAAGQIRNEAMAKYADALIAYWDGESTGTKGMIEYARQNHCKIIVVNYTTGKVLKWLPPTDEDSKQ